MPSDAEGIGHDREGRVNGRARREETAVDDVQIVELVGLAVAVEDRRSWVVAESNSAVLVSDAGERDLLAEVKVSGEQSLVALAAVDVAITLAAHQLFELVLQPLMRLDVVGRVREDDAAVPI